MALLSNKTKPVGDESLEKWELIGSGGFGYVFKARHKDWMFDVAIKILRAGVSSLPPTYKELYEEAKHMETVSCDFVVRVCGFYEGCPPRLPSLQQGIVMEFMERGSVQSLLEELCSPPPWPLAFRLAHQVALGMNFLHLRNLVHRDLKPSNVLLNDDLKAKITDFGLSSVSATATNGSKDTSGGKGGTFKYMPPEAFDISYNPVRAFDSYSYGILLWFMFAGKEPYPSADYNLVALRIPAGDRPPLKDIDQREAEGLEELVDLMTRCWDQDPLKRPKFKDCLKVTECVFSKHKRSVQDAVNDVLTKLDSPDKSQHQPAVAVMSVPRRPTAVKHHKEEEEEHQPTNNSSGTPEISEVKDSVDGRVIKSPSVQDAVSVSTMSNQDKAKFVMENRAKLIEAVSEVMAITDDLGTMVHGETYARIDAKDTSREKMRVLYERTLRQGVVKVQAAFFDALKKHHPALVEKLGG